MTKDTRTNEEIAKDRLKQGWLHVIASFEIVGKPKEHVEKTLSQLLDVFDAEKRFLPLERDTDEARPTDDGYFLASAELDTLVQDGEALTWLATNFTPSAIEIVEPLKFTFSAGDLQTWYNDLLANLHQIGYSYKTQVGELEFLKQAMGQLIDNVILLSIARSPKNLADLCRDTSLTEDTAKAHLKRLVEGKRIEEKAGLYLLP